MGYYCHASHEPLGVSTIHSTLGGLAVKNENKHPAPDEVTKDDDGTGHHMQHHSGGSYQRITIFFFERQRSRQAKIGLKKKLRKG